MPTSSPAPLIIIGAGWRAEFFLRIARELPHLFAIQGILARDPAKAQRLHAAFHVPAYPTLDELLQHTHPLYAIVSVPWKVSPLMLADLTARGLPCLAETPPAPDLTALDAINQLTAQGARIQVAEQYVFQPMHAARLAVAASSLLGTVSQAQVSAAHGYHGISLIRRLLNLAAEPVRITATRFTSPITQSPGRNGPPSEEKTVPSTQTLAWFDFGSRLGVFDFTGDQYFSYIRSPRVLVRGDRGEINHDRVRYLLDHRSHLEFPLERIDTGHQGNLEGHALKGYLGGNRWWYTNPFPAARLADDELAVATSMLNMTVYAQGGPDFYPLAEASYDHYLNLLLEQAATTQTPTEAPVPSWARW